MLLIDRIKIGSERVVVPMDAFLDRAPYYVDAPRDFDPQMSYTGACFQTDRERKMLAPYGPYVGPNEIAEIKFPGATLNNVFFPREQQKATVKLSQTGHWILVNRFIP